MCIVKKRRGLESVLVDIYEVKTGIAEADGADYAGYVDNALDERNVLGNEIFEMVSAGVLALELSSAELANVDV